MHAQHLAHNQYYMDKRHIAAAWKTSIRLAIPGMVKLVLFSCLMSLCFSVRLEGYMKLDN